MRVGISISESPELESRGLSTLHLQDAMVELARYLLARGDTLAYGGDLREGGFTRLLFDLVRTYTPPGAAPTSAGQERVDVFLAWPHHLRLNRQAEAELVGYAHIHRMAPPEDLEVDEVAYLAPDTARGRYVWARSLTVMREELNRKVDVKLLLGGRLEGYQGKFPGLAEEAYLALRDGKPTFLLGGFGGCVGAVIEALQGGAPQSLARVHRLAAPERVEMARLYAEQPPPDGEPGPDFDLIGFFQRTGMGGLRNGLSDEENRRLFETPYVAEMVSLVLRGLEAFAR